MSAILERARELAAVTHKDARLVECMLRESLAVLRAWRDADGAVLRAQVAGRAMVVNKFKPLMIEAVVRGYIIGSGWKDYQRTGAVCGIALPAGLQQAQKLPQVLFTPSSKAPAGEHDENITYADVEKIVGAKLAAQVRDVSIRLYSEAADFAAQRGVIIADTQIPGDNGVSLDQGASRSRR